MKKEYLDLLKQLRIEGYAVCIFTPDEMPNSNPDHVEDAMCVAGWGVINEDNIETE